MFKKVFIVMIMFAVMKANNLIAGPFSATIKVLGETVEAAAKKSGKALSRAGKKAASDILETAVKQYGDDALKVASNGGLEAIECISRYGDDFLRLASHSPQAARSLALNANELMPIAKRIGPEFMQLENKVPGLGAKAVKIFGDDSVKALNKLNADDAAKLIRLGEHADSPTTARLLLEKTTQSGGKILKHLDCKKIMAVGLSTAAIIAASKTADGWAEAMQTSPKTAIWGFWGFTAAVIALFALILLGPTLVKRMFKKLNKADQKQ